MKQAGMRNVPGVGRSAAVALVVVLLGGVGTRGDGQEDLSPEKVRLELGVLATWTSATYAVSQLSVERAVGDSIVVSMPVELTSPGAEGCATTVVSGLSPIRQVAERVAVAWEARLTVLSASLERIELGVDWKRYVRGADAEPRRVAGDRRSVILREGDRHLLDFVPVEEVGGRDSCHSLALELKAGVAEDPVLAERRIAYDLWLIDEAPGEPMATRRWQAAARHGELLDFDFGELRRPIANAGTSEGAPSRADTHVVGQVRGRFQNDGSLELALLASRSDSPGHRHWAIGGSGAKRVRVAAGETIRLELPTPRRDGAVKEEDDRVLSLLRAHAVSLVLTARSAD